MVGGLVCPKSNLFPTVGSFQDNSVLVSELTLVGRWIMKKCKHCKKPMVWTGYTLNRRPDDVKDDGTSPMAWAWHCKCGAWSYEGRYFVPKKEDCA